MKYIFGWVDILVSKGHKKFVRLKTDFWGEVKEIFWLISFVLGWFSGPGNCITVFPPY